MKITCDPVKRAATLADRKLDFLDADDVFAGKTLTVADRRRDYGEQRFQTVGHLRGLMVMVVWTPRSDAHHVMSMRRCNARERKIYSQRLAQS
ncbi:MAG TPA: BrnT family toxin [Pseudolabrys sp.]|nr:BrnT family toxin [Pseudolabrys sp.]